jgi:aspartate/methionine/tyrosine aminotransferase
MMHANPNISQIEAPPIAEAVGWLTEMATRKPLLNFCQAVPSYPPAPQLQSEIARLALDPAMGGYTDVLGLKVLREALALHFCEGYGASLDAKHVAVTTGCNQAFAAVVMAIAERGSEVIMPAPWYFNHSMWLRMLDIGIKPIASFGDYGNHPLVEDAERQIGSKTRAIILCSPNNPSGAIYPPAILEAFHDLAVKHGIMLILDETYRDFRENTEAPHAILKRNDWSQSFVQLHSFSKIYALAGYRLGAIVASTGLLKEAEKILDCMTICPPQISQRAVLFGLESVNAWKEEKRGIMRHRLQTLRDCFTRNALKYELVSSGSYFAYVRHPFENIDSKSIAKRLAQNFAVLSLPGVMFGPGQERYLRFAFANMEADFMPQMVDRLVDSQESSAMSKD